MCRQLCNYETSKRVSPPQPVSILVVTRIDALFIRFHFFAHRRRLSVLKSEREEAKRQPATGEWKFPLSSLQHDARNVCKTVAE